MTDNKQSRGLGRPVELTDGKRVNVYLDSKSLRTATRLGNGNLSLGIRLALEASEPPTIASVIEAIRSQHIFVWAGLFLEDLQEVVDGLTAGGQDKVLNHLGLGDPDSLRGLRQRENFEMAASSQGFDCYELWDEYVVTSPDEVKRHLATIDGEVLYDGAYHIHCGRFKQYSGAEFDDALLKWLGSEDGPWRVWDTREEAWRDACVRNKIQPIVLKPATYYIVSEALATELEQRGEIVSTRLIGEYRVWGCLYQVRSAGDLANVRVLETIATSQEARWRLLGTSRGS